MPVYLDEDYNHASNEKRHQDILSGAVAADGKGKDHREFEVSQIDL